MKGWWRDLGEREHILTLSSVEECRQDVVEAKQKELQNLIDNDVFAV